MKHSLVALGGTFDHLHCGHESLITYAFTISENVVIGLVADTLLQEKAYPQAIQSFSQRRESLELFLKQHGWLPRSRIVPLHDMYGPTRSDPRIEALIVTAETENKGRALLAERKKQGLPPLKLYVIPFIKSDNHRIIRSEKIRAGLMNREGLIYYSYFKTHPHLVLPPSLRYDMRTPIGTVFSHEKKLFAYLEKHPYTQLITVGDIVTQTCHAHSLIPHVSIVDYKTRRQVLARPAASATVRFIRNKPGSIQLQAVTALWKALQNHTQHRTIHIIGEEDLLALPAIVLSPLESVVIYGQFDRGIIATRVTEETKKSVMQLIRRFNSLC